MERITYKYIKSYILSWNENTPSNYPKFEISAYNGCYHLLYKETNNVMCDAETPGRILELFNVWKNGFFKGIENK